MNSIAVQHNTLIDILTDRAKSDPEKSAYTFLKDGEGDEVIITYGELYNDILQISSFLRTKYVKGERALLFFPPGLDFIKAFLGCLHSGVIAVPSYPPKLNRNIDKLNNFLSNSEPSVILTISDAGYGKVLDNLAPSKADIVFIDQLSITQTLQEKPEGIKSDDIAFIQYTSGSTGNPKGVMVSHKNLMHNEYLIQKSFNVTENSIVVGWLPFYHDMGLIGNILQPIYSGFHCVLMSPMHFLQKPSRWLTAISKYGATVSGGPNFAFDLCCDKISDDEIIGISLESWEVAFNGAEPVRASTLEKFYNKFKKQGFKKKAFLPCYGMAETTLLVSGIKSNEEPVTHSFPLKNLQFYSSELEEQVNRDQVELVSCGKNTAFELVLVDETGVEAKEGIVGEIWVKGESVTQGYWNRKQETNDTFKAQIKSREGEFLRTGDLGVLLNDELYIAGRVKDLIILNGRNYYPQDIELIVGKSNQFLINESVAAFGVEINYEEKIIVVAESEYRKDLNLDSVVQDIKQQLVLEFEFTPYDIVLVRKGTILKTTSGKVQRNACKAAYLNDTLKKLESFKHQPVEGQLVHDFFSETEKEIYNIIKEELVGQLVTSNDDLFALGINSIKLTRVVYRLGDFFGKELEPDFLLENNTISKIAANIEAINSYVPIARQDNINKFPASKLQEIIWFNQQRNPQSSGYHIPLVLEYEKDLDYEVLQKSIQYLVNKYSVFRTNFLFEGEQLQQIVKDSVIFSIKQVDLTGFDNSRLEEQCALVIKKESSFAFELEHDLPIRSVLIKKTHEKYVLLIVIHHIIVDGTSVVLFLKELKEIYKTLLNGGVIANVDSGISFIDYTKYESGKLSEPELERKKAFWKEELKGQLPKLSLPLDYSILKSKQREGESYYFEIGEGFLDRLDSAVKSSKTNQFSYLLSAYYLLLYRLSSSDDLIVGSPVSLRTRKELLNTHGLLINTAMLRIQLDGNFSLQELVRHVYSHTRGVVQNADYPFGQLLRDLDIPLGDDQLAISSVFFNYLDFTEELEAIEFFNSYSANPGVDLNFDLNLYALPARDIIKFRLDYCKNHFKADSVKLFSELYIKFLTELVDSSETIVQELKMRIDEGKNEVTPNNEFEPFKETDIKKLITERFKEIVLKYPERVAIKTNSTEYTYYELNSLSNNIAYQIALSQIGDKTAIGLLFGHEVNMITGILGVLISGNYYVPLDTEYPFERLTYILEDAGIKHILTNNAYLKKAQELIKNSQYKIEIINVDHEFTSKKQSFKNNLKPDSLAYILYTSGSTGTPKGVMQTHEYVMHLTLSFTNSLHISKEDCFTLIPSFNFSASVMDLFGVLLNGASLYLVDIKSDGVSRLLEGMEKEKVTVYHSVPTVFRAVCEEIASSFELRATSRENGEGEKENGIEESGVRKQESANAQSSQLVAQGSGLLTHSSQLTAHSLKSLRLIYLAGEPLLKNDVDSYKKLFHNDVILVNGLGCTEFNICRQFFVDKDTEIGASVVPIGYQAIGVDVLIVDENRKELKSFQPGEIAIKSRYLSKGYWNSIELTNSKFEVVDTPSNDRIYYTGDLGKKTIDGCLLHLGRKDFQVKLRGQRIELAEIETALLKVEGIRRVVVVLKDDEKGKYLCAYFISFSNIAGPILKEKLKVALPEYMIPSHFIRMDKFPLTDTGKVDRRKLPIPEIEISEKKKLSLKENNVAKIWSKILGVNIETLSSESNFFEIGGHSLKAIQLISELEKEINVRLELREIFAKPILSEMSKVIFEKEKNSHVEIPRANKKDLYPVSFEQRRMFILQQMDKESTSYNITLTCFLSNNIDIKRFETAFQKVIERHAILRTTFVTVDGQQYQKVSNDNSLKIQYLKSSREKLDNLIEDNIKPFDLAKAPLLRVFLIEVERLKNELDNQYMLLIDMHHIISDGFSIGVIVKDFAANYDNIALPPLEIQYTDYSEFQQNSSYKQIVANQKEYWKTMFNEEVPSIDLPVDFIRPAIRSNEGQRVYFNLDKEKVKEIKQFVDAQKLTLYMFLFGSYYILLSKLTHQDDIVIGTPNAGRNFRNLDSTVGMFVKTLPIRFIASGKENIIDFFERIKYNLINAFENQDYLFEELIDELKPEPDLSRNPLFDVMFVLQNMDIGLNNLDSLELDVYSFEKKTSKFDITFQAREVEDSLECFFEYNTSLFHKQTVERFIDYFKKIIDTILIENFKEANISSIEIINENEKNLILKNFNSTKVPYPSNKTIIHFFKEQVEINPNKVALKNRNSQLTYREFYDKVECLAIDLQNRGINADDIVIVLTERSFEMMIGIYAVLMAGGAYLPIAPNTPINRISYIVDDSKAKLILTNTPDTVSNLLESIKREVGTETVSINLNTYQYHTLNSSIKEKYDPKSLAYIIYTSGSTGNPKGVMIEHHSLVNRLNWMKNYFKVEENDILLQKTPFTFDVSVWEIFLWALSGSSLYLLNQDEEKDPKIITEAIVNGNVSIIHFVPSMLDIYLDSLIRNKGDLVKNSIKHIITSGEELLNHQFAKVKNLFDKDKTVLTNLYGPTEATIDVSFYNCSNTLADNESIPIGKPIDNIELYILSDDHKICPIGVNGELFISGVGIARGYLNNEKLTNEKFYTLECLGGRRLYKTGDLTRWKTDGNIEFLGRLDNQVKIRGNRIELGEIENQLLKVKEIKSCVLKLFGSDKDKFICAYYVSDKEIDSEALIKTLEDKLPSYMIPGCFIHLLEMPLTTSGKIDRKNLPLPTLKTKKEFQFPDNKTEMKLLEIWSKVLNVKTDLISTNDNFFHIGGHSLKGIELVNFINDEFHINLSFKELFKHQTIKNIANYIELIEWTTNQNVSDASENTYELSF